MKYLKIMIDPIKLKGDPEDEDTLRADLYEKLTAMIEAETLSFYIDDEEEDDDVDF